MSRQPDALDRRRLILFFLLLTAVALGLAAVVALLVVMSQNPHEVAHQLFVYGS